jgi:redox-sensitive bicupin YhaK (pirin superfamily)
VITIRPGRERGQTQIDWLDSRHTFSFDQYFDPDHMGFRKLRVLNEDVVLPGKGFDTHPHHDMEILTYVVEGTLKHKDSKGNASVIKPGDLQRITAGTGIKHSEFNYSRKEPVRFLQIWVFPNRRSLMPGYEQRTFKPEERQGKLCLMATGNGHNGGVAIHQDLEMYSSILEKGASVSHQLQPGRHAWLQVVRGKVTLNETPLEEGDGAAISDEETLTISAGDAAEIVLFDLV